MVPYRPRLKLAAYTCFTPPHRPHSQSQQNVPENQRLSHCRSPKFMAYDTIRLRGCLVRWGRPDHSKSRVLTFRCFIHVSYHVKESSRVCLEVEVSRLLVWTHGLRRTSVIQVHHILLHRSTEMSRWSICCVVGLYIALYTLYMARQHRCSNKVMQP
jgi:hypothetical protein